MTESSRFHVTDAELEVLRVLWEASTATIREVADRLYPGGGVAHYATVQKLLARLGDKRCVERLAPASGGSRAKRYRALVERSQLVASQLRDTADQLCEGSLTPLLTHLVRGGALSTDELDVLRRLVEEVE